jgi:hypothetical protein
MNVARIRFTLENGTYATIGKIYNGSIYYYNPQIAFESVISADIEVLACQACTNGGVGAYCCTNGRLGFFHTFYNIEFLILFLITNRS